MTGAHPRIGLKLVPNCLDIPLGVLYNKGHHRIVEQKQKGASETTLTNTKPRG